VFLLVSHISLSPLQVNYYIVAPTANHYAILLGADGAFGATLVGASSFSAMFGAVLYSLWYTRSSFRSALIFSAACPFVGNLLYALAISYKSLPLAIFGRVLVGFGSAEVVNRQLIAACVSFRYMTEASALFVAISAVGMSLGPLMAAILDMVSGRDTKVDIELPFFPAGGIIFNHVTSPGYIMACLWMLEMVALVVLFREPERINGILEPSSALTGFELEKNCDVEFVSDYGSTTILEVDPPKPPPTFETNSKPSGCWRTLSRELVKAKSLVFSNMALPLTLLLFGYVELVDEVLISSCSMVGHRYFSWHGSTAGLLIASLGALVLPAHFLVERASRSLDERAILKVCGSRLIIEF
jgi:Sugar (and other) transporter